MNRDEYELFGFVYKIQGFEFSNHNQFDLPNLRKAELISKTTHFNRVAKKNPFGVNEVDNVAININKITVFRIPAPNGKF